MARLSDDEKEQARGFYSDVGELPDEDMPPITGELVPLGDGSLSVDISELGLGEDPEEAKLAAAMTEFDANLAEAMSEQEQLSLGMRLKEYVLTDLESRRGWESRMKDGFQLIGVEDIPDTAVAFVGAARASFPGLAEAMVQFQARAMEEMMPADGPVKGAVVGKTTEAKEQQATRVQDHMNYQLMEVDDEYYNETDQLFLMLPYYGSVFKKCAPDPVTGENRLRVIPASDFIVPYSATSLQTAPRYTHRYTMPRNLFKRAVESGYFIDAEFQPAMNASDQTTSQELADRADEKTPSYHADDEELWFYEMTIETGLEGYEDPLAPGVKFDLPYVITFEWETGRVVRVARGWDPEDALFRKDVWFTHYKLLPGLGFYGWGYLHVIGGLGKAASGVLRLMLDGAAMASLQGGFKTKESRLAKDITIQPGVWKDVDSSMEDLAKTFFTPPYKEPSPALAKTLEILVNFFQRFASTTENVVGDAKNTGPVGTTVALIEQGSKLLSGIHKRCHAAQRREFKMLALANFRYLPDDYQYPFEVEGDMVSVKADYDPKTIDVVPVSDPNIFSSVQRIAIAQAVQQACDARPDIFPVDIARQVYRRLFIALKVPDVDAIMPDKSVKRLDPVSENEAFMHGHAIQVFREQDHGAHLAVHNAFEQEIMGMDPEIQERAIPVLKAHKAAHFAAAYRQRVEQQVMEMTGGIPLPPYDPNDPDSYVELPPEMEAQIARMAAQYAPPPPPPSPEEAGEDQAAARKADREDMLAQRKADREDAVAARKEERESMAQRAQLERDGVVSDLP